MPDPKPVTHVITSFPCRVAGPSSARLQSNLMIISFVSLDLITSLSLTEKESLSTLYSKVSWVAKIFLNAIVFLLGLGFMAYGPAGFDGRHCPINGQTYSPPIAELIVIVALWFPNLLGSNMTSKYISDPDLRAGAALIVAGMV